MSQTYTFINPGKTDQLFNNLGFAIEEIKLVRKISDLEDLAFQFKSTMPPKQVKFIGRKIIIAKARLEMIRFKAERQMNYRTQA